METNNPFMKNKEFCNDNAINHTMNESTFLNEKKKSGRPRKDETEKKTKKILISLTQEEYETIKARAKGFNLLVTQYIVFKALR